VGRETGGNRNWWEEKHGVNAILRSSEIIPFPEVQRANQHKIISNKRRQFNVET
jgi:hypothetical protein